MPSVETELEQKIQLTAATAQGTATEKKSDDSTISASNCSAEFNILKSLKNDIDANAKSDKLDVKIGDADLALPPRMPDVAAAALLPAPATVVAALNIIQDANDRKEKEI